MKRVIKKIKKAVKPVKPSIVKKMAPTEVVMPAKKRSHTKFILVGVVVLLVILGGLVIRQVGNYFVGEVVQTIAVDDNEEVALSTTTPANSLVGIKAPAFLLVGDQATSTRLLDLLDKPLVVVFWTTWQPAAVDQLRAFDEYLAKTDNSEFNTVFINYQEDDLLVRSFLRRSGYDLPVLFDEVGGVGNAWQVYTTPTTYLVGTDGFIKEKIIGNYSVGIVVDKLLNINP